MRPATRMTTRRLRRLGGVCRGLPSLGVLLALLLTAGMSLVALAVPAAALPTCLTIPAGIEAWWTGDATPYELVHGRDGTLANGADYTTGVVGQAFTFDGVGDAVEVADSPAWSLGSSDFTQALWVKMDKTSPAVFTSHDEGPSSPYPKWIFFADSGVLYFGVNWPFNWQTMVAADWAPTLGTWYHVAVTRQGDGWALYVNGTEIGSATRAAELPEIEAPVRLGYAELNEEGEFSLDGALDEVSFFHRGLSAAEIRAIYDAGAAGLCDPIATTLTMTPSKTTVWNGLPVTISGGLVIDGPVSQEGQTITVTRSVNGNPAKLVATLTTAQDGTYTYKETPPLGTVRYVAWFEGADNAVPASAKTTVTVKMGESTVSLAAGDRHLVIGQGAKLTATLVGGRVNRDVTIWAKPVGQTKRVVKRGAVGADDVLVARVEPRLSTTYWATYAGDITWTPDTSREIPVDVKVKWRDWVFRDYAMSGKYHLFHFQNSCKNRSVDCPAFAWELMPDHAGKAVTYIRETQMPNGTWRRFERISFKLNKYSQLGIYFRYNDEVIGLKHRVRVVFSGDAHHVGDASDWIYWKVTR